MLTRVHEWLLDTIARREARSARVWRASAQTVLRKINAHGSAARSVLNARVARRLVLLGADTNRGAWASLKWKMGLDGLWASEQDLNGNIFTKLSPIAKMKLLLNNPLN